MSTGLNRENATPNFFWTPWVKHFRNFSNFAFFFWSFLWLCASWVAGCVLIWCALSQGFWGYLIFSLEVRRTWDICKFIKVKNFSIFLKVKNWFNLSCVGARPVARLLICSSALLWPRWCFSGGEKNFDMFDFCHFLFSGLVIFYECSVAGKLCFFFLRG